MNRRDRKNLKNLENHSKCVDDSFYNAILPIVKLMQFISTMPLSNIKRDAPNSLKFEWSSLRLWYCFAFIAYGAFESILMFIKINGEGITAKNIGERLSEMIKLFIVESTEKFIFYSKSASSSSPTRQRALSYFCSLHETFLS